MLLLFILFFIPGVMMIIAYGLISRELYRGIQFEQGQNTESSGEIQQKPKANNNKLFNLHLFRWNTYYLRSRETHETSLHVKMSLTFFQ